MGKGYIKAIVIMVTFVADRRPGANPVAGIDGAGVVIAGIIIAGLSGFFIKAPVTLEISKVGFGISDFFTHRLAQPGFALGSIPDADLVNGAVKNFSGVGFNRINIRPDTEGFPVIIDGYACAVSVGIM